MSAPGAPPLGGGEDVWEHLAQRPAYGMPLVKGSRARHQDSNLAPPLPGCVALEEERNLSEPRGDERHGDHSSAFPRRAQHNARHTVRSEQTLL